MSVDLIDSLLPSFPQLSFTSAAPLFPFSLWQVSYKRFGMPFAVFPDAVSTNADVHAIVGAHVARFVRPVEDDAEAADIPYTLRTVKKNGMRCAVCAFTTGCRGCELPNDGDLFGLKDGLTVAVDWGAPSQVRARYNDAAENETYIHATGTGCVLRVHLVAVG